MSNHNPDKWVIVNTMKDVYKVLAGWSGGYLDGDSWRMSSGLEKIEEEGDYYLMHNYSSSIYKCHKKAEGMNMISAGIYSQLQGVSDEVKTVTVEEFNEATKDNDESKS